MPFRSELLRFALQRVLWLVGKYTYAMGGTQGESEIVEIAKRSVIIEDFALDKLFSTYYVFCVLMLMSLLLVRKEQQFCPVQVAVFAIFIGQYHYSSGGNTGSHCTCWDEQKDPR